MKDDLEYSLDAENSLSEFTETDYIVYVEDKNDEFFWVKIFSIFSKRKTFSFRYEENITGCSILDEKIEQIKSGKLNNSIIVARDSDYLEYQNKKTSHKNILYTYGHSIENCLFSKIALDLIIENYSRGKISKKEINIWSQNIHDQLQELIKLDIILQFEQRGIQVLGNSCDRFLKRNSNELDNQKISMFIENTINNEHYIKENISNIEKVPFHFIKGHFLVSLISQFIRHRCLFKSLPLDNLISTSFILLDKTLEIDNERIDYYSDLCSLL